MHWNDAPPQRPLKEITPVITAYQPHLDASGFCLSLHVQQAIFSPKHIGSGKYFSSFCPSLAGHDELATNVILIPRFHVSISRTRTGRL